LRNKDFRAIFQEMQPTRFPGLNLRKNGLHCGTLFFAIFNRRDIW